MRPALFVFCETESPSGRRSCAEVILDFPDPVASQTAFQTLKEAVKAYLERTTGRKFETVLIVSWQRLEAA